MSPFKYQLELSFLCFRIVFLLTSALNSVEVLQGKTEFCVNELLLHVSLKERSWLSSESELYAQDDRHGELMK